MMCNYWPNNRPNNRPGNKMWRMLFIAILSVAVTACGMFENKQEYEYLKSKSTPPLTVPDGLQLPEQSREYDIPALADAGTADLDELKKLEPPPGMDDALLTAMDAEEAGKTGKDGVEALTVRTARNTEGYDLLVVEADFDLSWDRVGEALKKLGFKIGDSDRGNRVYVIYQDVLRETTDEEKFLRPRGDKGPREEYQVHLDDRDTQTRISIHNQGGKPDDSALAKHLLVQLRAMLEHPQ